VTRLFHNVAVAVAARTPRSPFDDEATLVAALRSRDEAAFGYLLDRYDGALRRLARTYVSTPQSADEVVQDTWLAVVKGIDGFEGRSSVSTWIYRILANIARSRGVREHRSVPFSSAPGALEEGAGPAVDPDRFVARATADGAPVGAWARPPSPWDEEPEARLESRTTLEAVQAAIDALPPAQREVLTLRDVEGWTSAEVCNALGLSETNQRVLLHRGRSKVRRALERHFDEVSA
jgi:RNA polymerase sigma-70 factor (ECF subfamily)